MIFFSFWLLHDLTCVEMKLLCVTGMTRFEKSSREQQRESREENTSKEEAVTDRKHTGTSSASSIILKRGEETWRRDFKLLIPPALV